MSDTGKRGNGCIKSGCEFGCLTLFVFVAIAIIIPQVTVIKKRAPVPHAINTVNVIAKECLVKKSNGEENPTFTVPKIDNIYTFLPASGNCDGDENNLLSAVSKDPSRYPTFSYNVETREKTCIHDGPNEELHACSARRNGEWK